MASLPPDLVERVLEALGLAAPPSPGLASVCGAWCRNAAISAHGTITQMPIDRTERDRIRPPKPGH